MSDPLDVLSRLREALRHGSPPADLLAEVDALLVAAGAAPRPFTARSPAWRRLRATHLLQEPACAACGATEDLEVHHIEPVHLVPTRELDPDNLITLCDRPGRSCHWLLGHCGVSWSAHNPHVRADAAVVQTRITEARARLAAG
jgi:hypothetical protein